MEFKENNPPQIPDLELMTSWTVNP